MKRNRIDLESRLGSRLLEVEKPARYLGGEIGSLPPLDPDDDSYVIALSFPDLYEIGMSNTALRILYRELNAIPGVRCERVFAPASDMIALMAELEMPLHTIESGIPLSEVDMIGFTVGYELAGTAMLGVLDRGGLPIHADERLEHHPIVIAGGPGVSNPHPFAAFLDAVYIGEAEAAFFKLVSELRDLKKRGATRSASLKRIREESAVWMPGKKAYRAIYSDFSTHSYRNAWPIASFKTVQDHGTVEIMRGCPNGCRFCHAGFYYRPQRMKSAELIREEVRALVEDGGYREITLSSLSSGDYSGISDLLSSLNSEWAPKGISFQLPSLKISSFTLPLIEAVSEVRKSGLTFAVETPEDSWQLVLNKDVSYEKTRAILEEAIARGFKVAKFYFMIGLPVPGRGMGEAEAIIEFFNRLAPSVRISLNVNVGTFVPKPHTPFQWCRQLKEDEALQVIYRIKDGLKKHRNIKLSYHSPFLGCLEGIIARGDERVGRLLERAYRTGCYLDAWEEHFDRDLWRTLLESEDWKPLDTLFDGFDLEARLPWEDVSISVAKKTLKEEYERSQNFVTTSLCVDNCTHPCGACGDDHGIVYNSKHAKVASVAQGPRSGSSARLVFSFEKRGRAKYLSHLSVLDAFSRMFLMLDLPVSYSEGFNPMPRLETVQPLPMGFEALGEVASLVLASAATFDEPGLGALLSRMNARLPSGLVVRRAEIMGLREGRKPASLGSLAWGSRYLVRLPEDVDLVAFAEKLRTRYDELGGAMLARFGVVDKGFEVLLPDPAKKELGLVRLLESTGEWDALRKSSMLCRVECLAGSPDGPISYFEALRTR